MTKAYKMHVISGTHWDREWRHTAEQSKPRLVELIDSIIETLESKPSYKAFCLDGGMVVLEDYLSIRPEKKEKIKELVKTGRIYLQNWFTLPELFTVAPEALIRNLKLGQKMASEFGGAMKSGYTPTSYGQPSQLPQLYQGFGLKNAIFYRGTSKFLLKPLFCWEGPDGSKIDVLRTFDEVTRTNWFFYMHQPLVLNKRPADLQYHYDSSHKPAHTCDEELYQRGFKVLCEKPDFNRSPQAIKEALQGLMEQAQPYAIGNNILALNMEDNESPFILLPDMIDVINEVTDDVELVQSTLDEYMDEIESVTKKESKPVYNGELRYTQVEPGFNGLLGATHSSRIKLKRLNEQAERGLIYHAEPLASLSAIFGCEYPTTNLERAWRHLLLNHAHDSICGAAVDQAHEDMLYNFSIAQMVSEEITARSVISIYNNIDTSSKFEPGDQTITFFNTLPFDREVVSQVAIDIAKSIPPDGIADPCTGFGASCNDIEYYDIVDENSNEVEYEFLSKENVNISVEREFDTKGIKMPAVRHRLLIKANVPGLGYSTCALRPRDPKYLPLPENGPDRKLIARENAVLENEHLKVNIKPNGTFSMLDKQNGRLLENQHYFTDQGEVGVAHFSKQPQRDIVETSLGSVARIRMVESNLLRGIFRIDLELTVPAAATLDGRDRLREEKTIPVTTWLTLEKDAPILKIRSRITNDSRDHRLRVNFPSYVKTDYATMESVFKVEKRCIRWTVTGDNFEKFYPFNPMHNFVDVNDDKVGLAVLNRGLREYEVKDDPDRTIAITLLRTHRAYMTPNSDMTPDEFEKYTGLHGFGSQEYEYALYPHKGDWDQGHVLQRAYDFKVCCNAVHGLPMQGTLPPSQSFFKIGSDRIMLSCFKKAEDDNGFILRLWNTSPEIIKTSIETSLPISSASLVKLNEDITSELPLKNGKIPLEIGPHKITSILINTQ